MTKLSFILFLLFYLVIPQSSFSQEKVIEGKVTSVAKTPVEGATIVIKDLDNSKVLSYAVTDNKGYYNLLFNSSKEKVFIKVAHISYKDSINTISIHSKTTTYNLSLNEDVFEIQGIVITTTKIRDTMAIPTDSLKLTQRSTLRDILDKTDGFVVSEDGGISFRGRLIKKVLINKKEVFVDQNRIALDNLDYGIMENLELINNYKDKFGVDFNNFSTSVININTKEEFKGVLKLFGDGAYGIEENKYLIKARGLYFSDELNSFLTSNTNSIGEKEFSFKDVSQAFKEQSSTFFKSNFTPFFNEDDLLAEAFDSNTSLTVRKETRRARIGFVSYYNNSKNVKNIFQNTKTNDGFLVKSEERGNDSEAYSFLNNLLVNYALSPKSVLTLNIDQAYSKSQLNNTLDISNFSQEGDESIIQERNLQTPSSFLLYSKLGLRSRLSKKLIFSSDFEFNIENSKSDFRSDFIRVMPNQINQSYSFNNQYIKLNSSIDHQFSSSISASANIESTFFSEDLEYDIIKNDSRKGSITDIGLRVRGQKSKWDYDVIISTQIYSFKGNGSLDRESQTQLRFNGNANINLNQNNTFTINLFQENNLIDLYSNIDSLVIGFNNRLTNPKSISREITKDRGIDVSYNYSSIIKTQSIRAKYSYNEKLDYLEPIFNTINDEVFFFINRLIDKRESSRYSILGSKGFYLTKRNHLIRFTGEYSLGTVKYPTFVSETRIPFEIRNKNIKGILGFELKKMFLDEISFRVDNLHQEFLIDNQNTSDRNILSYSTKFSKKTDNFEFDFLIGQNKQESEGFSFKVPFFDFSTNIKISPKLDAFIRGKYLFHLFDLPNTDFTDLSVSSDGNFIYRNFNRNNLNYLIIGISYKI